LRHILELQSWDTLRVGFVEAGGYSWSCSCRLFPPIPNKHIFRRHVLVNSIGERSKEAPTTAGSSSSLESLLLSLWVVQFRLFFHLLPDRVTTAKIALTNDAENRIDSYPRWWQKNQSIHPNTATTPLDLYLATGLKCGLRSSTNCVGRLVPSYYSAGATIVARL